MGVKNKGNLMATIYADKIKTVFYTPNGIKDSSVLLVIRYNY
jgi:hypothetical protein